MANENTVKIEDAKIIFRNFKGAEDQFNRAGDRNFGVLLDDTAAAEMAEDNWNVKWLKPKEQDGDEDLVPQAWLPVAVSYKVRPPRIVIVTSGGRTNLDEGTVEMLDFADFSQVDLIINPYAWVMSDKSGVKAYLKTMFVTIEEDELERKYGVIDSGSVIDDD